MKRSHVSESTIRSAIFNLSNRLRRDRNLIYTFGATERIILMQVMIDPEGSWQKLRAWAKSSEEIPTWDDVLKIAQEQGMDVSELCRIQGWALDDLRAVYERLREIREDVRSGE
jgi:hypothetical protein